MKKFIIISLYSLITLFSNLSYVHAEEITYEWFKTQTKNTTANDLVWEKDFKNFLKKNISPIKVYLGMNKGKKKVPLVESYIKVLSGAPYKIIYKKNKRYVFTNACAYQSCGQKGVIFLDTKKKYTIGLIRHSLFNDTKFTSDPDFLIFSKNHKSFDEIPTIFIEMVKEWITTSHMNSSPSKVRFIGSNNNVVEVTKEFNK